MTDGGSMTTELTVQLIRNLPEGITEFCFHPSTRRCNEIDRTMPFYRHEDEFKALTSKSLLDAIRSAGAQKIAFSDLGNMRRK